MNECSVFETENRENGAEISNKKTKHNGTYISNCIQRTQYCIYCTYCIYMYIYTCTHVVEGGLEARRCALCHAVAEVREVHAER